MVLARGLGEPEEGRLPGGGEGGKADRGEDGAFCFLFLFHVCFLYLPHLQFVFSVILYWCQACGVVNRQSYTLRWGF